MADPGRTESRNQAVAAATFIAEQAAFAGALCDPGDMWHDDTHLDHRSIATAYQTATAALHPNDAVNSSLLNRLRQARQVLDRHA